MIPKRNISSCRVLLLMLILRVLLLPLEISAKDNIPSASSIRLNPTQSEQVTIRIYDEKVINDNFYGFGTETLPWLWTKENKEAGINEDDIRLNLERIRYMDLPITRIFVPWETWNPTVDYKTFTWESDEMRSLYKTLDIYQEIGTSVIIVTVDWLEDCPWQDAEGSAEAVLTLLEYLVRERGYSCIRFWTLTNEPEGTYGWMQKLPFENYVQIHRLVKEGLSKRGLPIKIIVSDEVESQEWFERSVKFLYGAADVFSSHAYFYPRQIQTVADFFRKRINIIKKASLAKRDIPFFLCEFGFRGSDFGVRTNSFMQDYEYGLYVANLCVEVLNSGVDAASLWCLNQIRLIDEIKSEGGKMMRIGLWAYKDEDWHLFPIFYLYRLFTKYIKSGSEVLEVKISSNHKLKAACVKHGGHYSLFIVNMEDESKSFVVRGLPEDADLKKYIYADSKSFCQQTMLEADALIKARGYLRGEIPSGSVILYTNMLEEHSDAYYEIVD